MALDTLPPHPEASAKGACITIGTFDGVHLGHQSLLNEAANRADQDEMVSIALTFRQMPRAVIDPSLEVPFLCDLPTRISLIENAGIDIVQPIDFDDQVRNTTAERFMSTLKEKFNLRCLVIGRNARVGNDQLGFDQLGGLGEELGFEVAAQRDVLIENRIVSSSAIRSALGEGDVRRAATMLGRLYERGGEVESGTGRARDVIAPTANMQWSRSLVMPAPGIYASWARMQDGRILPSATYIGDNPTLGGSARTFETHVLGIEEDLYGQKVSAMFVEFVRPDEKFDTPELLVEQMQRDVRSIEEILENEQPPA